MEELLRAIALDTALVLEAAAVLIVAFGAATAGVRAFRAPAVRRAAFARQKTVFLTLGTWLLLLRKRVTWVAVAAAACVPLVMGVGGTRRVVENGPLSDAHAMFEKKCEVCHTQPFGAVAGPQKDPLLSLEAYLAFVAFAGLLLAAFTEQRRRAFVSLALHTAVQDAFF